ncbi:copper transporter [Fragilariopsis cylindrus CCMP1102]|uniref:Copper transport protein n=1 Tax=Fragilariopsis cylindrus CCMP1102 TaxID=635003 RepID=A0A1E7FMG6_9STRA|nr:copper transporter [Fragilariopsis cylindrus CCMP1102]|eukprot:OEU19327.1 copper transporter [Fragilariopsis cylindrus CCMP1102]
MTNHQMNMNMNMNNDADDTDDDNYYNDNMDFCKGMFMTMSMKGFQSALFSNNKSDCLTFLFTNWKLDSSGKFLGAMIYTFLLAVLSEWGGITTIRIQNVLSRNQRLKKYKYSRKCSMTVLYGLQQFLSWGLMLISMTFSIELFLSVIFGIFIGKLLFPPPSTDDWPPVTTTMARRSTRIADDDHNSNYGNNNNNNNNNNDIIAPLLSSQSEEEESSNGSSSAVRRRRR